MAIVACPRIASFVASVSVLDCTVAALPLMSVVPPVYAVTQTYTILWQEI